MISIRRTKIVKPAKKQHSRPLDQNKQQKK